MAERKVAMTTEFNITRGDEAIAVSVEWRYWPEVAGSPPDQPHFEFQCALDSSGDHVVLTLEEIKQATREAWKRIRSGR